MSDYRFVEDDPIPLQKQMTVFRKNVEPLVANFSDQIAAVRQLNKSTKAAYESAPDNLDFCLISRCFILRLCRFQKLIST